MAKFGRTKTGTRCTSSQSLGPRRHDDVPALDGGAAPGPLVVHGEGSNSKRSRDVLGALVQKQKLAGYVVDAAGTCQCSWPARLQRLPSNPLTGESRD